MMGVMLLLGVIAGFDQAIHPFHKMDHQVTPLCGGPVMTSVLEAHLP
jgi:hypothetical protein